MLGIFRQKKCTNYQKITIKEIRTSVIDGNTYYYIIDTSDNKYRVSIKVNNIIPEHLEALHNKLKEMGVNITVEDDNAVKYDGFVYGIYDQVSYLSEVLSVNFIKG